MEIGFVEGGKGRGRREGECKEEKIVAYGSEGKGRDKRIHGAGRTGLKNEREIVKI